MIWTRRQFLASAAFAAARRKRPNVLLVMSDQESALLPGPANLPNRRKLIQRGVRFTHAFCNTPQCSAARSALVTGLEPNRTGVWTNVDGHSLGKPLPTSTPNVGSVLRAAGYSTGYFGKWHLGNDSDGLAKYGFETTGAVTTGKPGQDDLVSRQASEWIRRQKGPWLAWVSVFNPHNIYHLPKIVNEVQPRPGVRAPFSNISDLQTKPSEQLKYVEKDQGSATRNFTPEEWIRYRSYYLELVEKVDANLGTVLSAVPDLDSTIVVYTSDHGDALGEHGLPFKGPFIYEELTRIPFVLSAPGVFQGGRDDNRLVTQADLAPTLAALCAVEWPKPVSGRNLTRGRLLRDAVFLEYYAKQHWVNPIRTIRTRQWKLNWYDSGHKELYDLSSDPHEVKNRAGEKMFAAIQGELEARLNAWRGPLT